MPLLDHFDLLAPLYDRVIRSRDTSHLAALAGLPVDGRLLDVGGGTGRIARFLVGHARQVVVADESWKMLSYTPTGYTLHLAAAHAERLPFPDGAFDRVIMVDAYHHVQNQDRSLSELLRVCAPKGLVVVEEPDILRFGVKLIALGERLLLMRSRFRRAEEIADSFHALGARARVFRQDVNAWVVAEKAPSR